MKTHGWTAWAAIALAATPSAAQQIVGSWTIHDRSGARDRRGEPVVTDVPIETGDDRIALHLDWDGRNAVAAVYLESHTQIRVLPADASRRVIRLERGAIVVHYAPPDAIPLEFDVVLDAEPPGAWASL